MNIAMFTNAYEPVIGGLQRSIITFSEDLRSMGHKVLIVTLEFAGAEESDDIVFRMPAAKEIGDTPYSVKLPIPAGLRERLDAFSPDIIHSHHPFMVGDTAVRTARERGLPLLFTHHTLYEQYAYLFLPDSEAFKTIAETIATKYANLCDLVISPTKSIERMIRKRGVHVPIEVIPTGIDVDEYANGNKEEFKERYDIPRDSFVIGYLGRVVAAKNLDYITEAAVEFLSEYKESHFLVVGEGDAEEGVRKKVENAGVGDRVIMTGSLKGSDVADAYAAMDLFLFASKTETQGIVLIESLSAGVPVIGLDAPGTRDIIKDDKSGIILDSNASFKEYTEKICALKEDNDRISSLSEGARKRALDFDRKLCAEKLVEAYAHTINDFSPSESSERDIWDEIQQRFTTEWDLFKEKLSVISAAMRAEEDNIEQ